MFICVSPARLHESPHPAHIVLVLAVLVCVYVSVCMLVCVYVSMCVC
jgi:hypothetical protein